VQTEVVDSLAGKMGRLILAGHAQASFRQQNYDKLSALGETQARLLGEYWAQRKVVSRPSERYC
jgi:broad specificity phosphatase PhoE